MPSGIRNNRFREFDQALHAEQRKRLSRAAIVVQRRAKELVSVSGTGVKQGSKVVPAVKTGRGRIYGAFPSRPGEPPHKQTGRLRASIAWEVVATLGQALARVGTNVKYGLWLEVGTRRMAARPWLRRSLAEKLTEIRAIIAAPWKWN